MRLAAAVAELADALDSGSSEATRAGSTPVGRNATETSDSSGVFSFHFLARIYFDFSAIHSFYQTAI